MMLPYALICFFLKTSREVPIFLSSLSKPMRPEMHDAVSLQEAGEIGKSFRWIHDHGPKWSHTLYHFVPCCVTPPCNFLYRQNFISSIWSCRASTRWGGMSTWWCVVGHAMVCVIMCMYVYLLEHVGSCWCVGLKTLRWQETCTDFW